MTRMGFPFGGGKGPPTQLHTCQEFGAVFKVVGTGFAAAVKQRRPGKECGGSQRSGRVSSSAMAVAYERSERLD